MKSIIVTGSSGLIGSEVVERFCKKGVQVFGIDNNMRAAFFGPEGDTRWNQIRLQNTFQNFTHIELDIRHREEIVKTVKEIKPYSIVHAAAQPSHDLAAVRPFDDFDINAVGTLNLLEAARQTSKEIVFVHLSTNKVYGDAPNSLDLVELDTRYDYLSDDYINGIAENFSIDNSKHSVFGASKVAADIMVQEYGKYFSIPSCCLRGGCLTGPSHSGVSLHGFLSYLIKCNLDGEIYSVFGYKGKQVRDNIHSRDVCNFIELFIENPRIGEVYNIGGGRENSISILEAFELISDISGRPMRFDYSERNREGDHICYISDLTKMKSHYPTWEITHDLKTIFQEIYMAWEIRDNQFIKN